MNNQSKQTGYVLSCNGVPIQSLSFMPSADSSYMGVYAQYKNSPVWSPLGIELPFQPTLQQVRDANRNILLNAGSYDNAHFYLRSAEGNNVTTAFYTNADGGGIQSGDTDGYTDLNLQPLGGKLNYGGKEVATKNWVFGINNGDPDAAGFVRSGQPSNSLSTFNDLGTKSSYMGSIYANGNTPDGTTNTFWNVISAKHRNGMGDGVNYGLQIANIMSHGGSPNSGRMWFRNQFSGSWGNWYELATQNWVTAQGFLSALAGTTNRITVSGNTINIAANYAGQNTINTLGTVTTGTWNGSAIGVGYGGTGQTSVGTNGQTLRSNGTSWSMADALTLGGAIPASANLNTYLTTGIYIQGTNANAASGTNYPVAYAGKLEVVTSGTFTWQVYHVYGSTAASDRGIWRRELYSGTWQPWTKLADSSTGYEVLANKATSFATLDNTKYPTTQAVVNAFAHGNAFTTSNYYTALNNIGAFDMSPANNDWTWHDIFAFNATRYQFETTTDYGSTWTAQGANATAFKALTQQKQTPTAITLTNTSGVLNGFRATFYPLGASLLSWITFGLKYTAPVCALDILIETSADNSTWTTIYTISNKAPNVQYTNLIRLGGNALSYVRITIAANASSAAGSTVNFNSLRGLTFRSGDQGLGKEYEFPYAWDADKNIFFTTSATTTASGYQMALLNSTTGQLVRGTMSDILDGTYIRQNGNSLGTAMVIGTNDNYQLSFKTNNVIVSAITTNGYYAGSGIMNGSGVSNSRIATSSTGVLIERDVADGQIPLIVNSKQGTGSIQVWQQANSAVSFMALDGTLYGAGISNGSANTNSRVQTTLNGTVISRNVADGSTTLNVNNVHAAATGNIQTWQFNNVTKSFIKPDGSFVGNANVNNTSIRVDATDSNYYIIASSSTGWARGLIFRNSVDNTNFGGYGMYGNNGTSFTYGYIGAAYNGAILKWTNTGVRISPTASDTTVPQFLLDVNAGTVAGANTIVSFAQNNGYIRIENGSGSANSFSPVLRGAATTSNAWGLLIQGQGFDSYSFGSVTVRGLNAAGTGTVTNGNVFKVQNFTTDLLSVDYLGNITSNSLAGTGTRIVTASSTGLLGSVATLTVPNGGTGATSLTGIVTGNGTSAMTAVTGTAGQLLRRNAANTGYEFFTANYVSDNAENVWLYRGGFNNTDANTLNHAGWYDNGAGSPTLTNYPVASAGFLKVTPYLDSSFNAWEQEFVACPTWQGYANRKWFRTNWNGGIQPWREYAFVDWVQAQGYLTSVPDLQNVATAGNSFNGDLLLGISGSELYVGSTNVGDGNTRLGRSTLISVTNGNWNTAIGSEALKSFTNGVNNTAVGEVSLIDFVSGNNNTAIGDSAGIGVTGGNNNVYLGMASGQAFNGNRARGDNNTFIGRSAGVYNIAGTSALGSYNIALGAGAGQNRTNASNQLFIGNYDPSLFPQHLIEGVMGTAQTLKLNAAVTINSLAGSGTRMVVADASGVLSTLSIGASGSQWTDNMGYSYLSANDPNLGGGHGIYSNGGYASNYYELVTPFGSIDDNVEFAYRTDNVNADKTVYLPDPAQFPNRIINITNFSTDTNAGIVFDGSYIPVNTEMGQLVDYLSSVKGDPALPQWIQIMSIYTTVNSIAGQYWMVMKAGRKSRF